MDFQQRCRAAAFAAATLIASTTATAATPLPKLNIDRTQITVSGLSSGAFMATQLGYAYSATFKGVGVFAGGPYACAAHNNYTACIYNATLGASQLSTMQGDIDRGSGSTIDAKANVANQKVYLFVGNSDTTVGPNPMNAVQTQYANNGVGAANLDYVKRDNTAHTFPTDFDGTGDNACNSAASPYVSNCGYDGAKAVLTKFYGTLAQRNDAPAAGNFVQFDQTAFTTNPGMAATGWAYVPANCASGALCKLHVALHGCLQSYSQIGDKFLKNTGYARWADTNSIVVLFPQTQVDNTSRSTTASGSLANPNACWDWIGWYGTNFAQKAGTQSAAIKAMVDQVSSGSSGGSGGGGGSSLAAPTGVATSAATASSLTVTWNAVGGAASYDVYRNGVLVNASPVTTTRYVDGGLASATTFAYAVSAVDGSGKEGTRSTTASGTTTGTAATCYTASNYAHTQAGRAYQTGGYAYANGSGQNMGLWNTYVTTTLKQTGANAYVIGTCP